MCWVFYAARATPSYDHVEPNQQPRSGGTLFWLFRLLTIAQPYPWTAAILVDEFDAS